MASDTLIGQQVHEVLQRMKDQISSLLLLLSERERYVVERRFGLDTAERVTLEEIGQHFQVTRERVRQIEKNALQKLRRNVDNTDLSSLTHLAFQILSEHGGALREDILLSKLIQKDDQQSAAGLIFILSLDKRFSRFPNTIALAPHYRSADIAEDLLHDLYEISLSVLRKQKDILSLQELRKAVLEKKPALSAFSVKSFESFYQIHKSFKLLKSDVGLVEWKHIHPRTLRDKILYVLRKKKKPMHFLDISNSILEESFDRKNINLQAVHNELIRHDGFILIGRGIYALQEWGYSTGTVADVITSVLQEHDSLSEAEIVEKVLEKRQVKPITILLNLKNKPQFTRVGRKQYTLKKA